MDIQDQMIFYRESWFTSFGLDHPYVVMFGAVLVGAAISLLGIRLMEGPFILRRCAWHPGGKTIMNQGSTTMPLGRSISLAIEFLPGIRWWVAPTDGLCLDCARRANEIIDRELVK